ncbi:MAG: hypothetical protein OXP69_20455 [Spirochaetaceae bacterium]|nr:hypothetical protein [Spirochaetaceae bacterium]
MRQDVGHRQLRHGAAGFPRERGGAVKAFIICAPAVCRVARAVPGIRRSHPLPGGDQASTPVPDAR